MLADWTLDQWFVAGLVVVVAIGLLRRSLRTTIALGFVWLLLYWPTMFTGGLIGEAAEKFERDSQMEISSNVPLEPGYLGSSTQ